MNRLYFNNKNSFLDFGLIVVNAIEYPFIAKQYERVEVIGREDGYLTELSGYGTGLDITVNFRLIDASNYNHKIRKITEWLSNINDNKLYFSDYKEKFYKVKYVTLSKIKDSNFKTADFTATFNLHPNIYLNNEEEEVVRNNSEIYYDGDFDGIPDIELTLPESEVNISITINDKTFQFKGVSGRINIYSSLLLAVNDKKQQITSKMIGQFPYLQKGFNQISWVGPIDEFKIFKNTRYWG